MSRWTSGAAPVAVVLLTLNESHHLDEALRNLEGWASQVFVVDSCSVDDTVGVALRHGAHVVQRRFRGFGDQWNFALRELPITVPWTLKLDPDERLSDDLKREIIATLAAGTDVDAYEIPIRLHFLRKRLPRRLVLTRLWRSGRARFSDVQANEHAEVPGRTGKLAGEINHLDSPSLEHWVAKQNRYSTAEAALRFRGDALAAIPRLTGSALERRMWLKTHFWSMPGRYALLFLHHWLVQGGWRAGRAGWIWAHLRTEAYRMQEYKLHEMRLQGHEPAPVHLGAGEPDPRVPFHE